MIVRGKGQLIGPVQRPYQCGERSAMQSREIIKDPFNHASMSHIGAVMLRVLDRALKKEIRVSVDDIS